MTRTIFAGEVPEEIKPVYELVLKKSEANNKRNERRRKFKITKQNG